MKTTKNLLITLVFLIGTNGLYARPQEPKNDKFETVSIKTSAICGMCKDRLEKKHCF